jgi:hypothetical protein
MTRMAAGWQGAGTRQAKTQRKRLHPLPTFPIKGEVPIQHVVSSRRTSAVQGTIPPRTRRETSPSRGRLGRGCRLAPMPRPASQCRDPSRDVPPIHRRALGLDPRASLNPAQPANSPKRSASGPTPSQPPPSRGRCRSIMRRHLAYERPERHHLGPGVERNLPLEGAGLGGGGGPRTSARGSQATFHLPTAISYPHPPARPPYSPHHSGMRAALQRPVSGVPVGRVRVAPRPWDERTRHSGGALRQSAGVGDPSSDKVPAPRGGCRLIFQLLRGGSRLGARPSSTTAWQAGPWHA